MRLRIFKEVAVRVPRSRLQKLFDEIVRSERSGKRNSEVNLILTGNRRLKSLNTDYKGKNRTTDVLSFNIDAREVTGGTFGEVYVSIPEARRQATEYGASLSEELLRLACHGFLHLFGYDHIRSEDEKKMKRREEEILGRVYSR